MQGSSEKHRVHYLNLSENDFDVTHPIVQARQRLLPMKIIEAEYQFDRNKLTFFFKLVGYTRWLLFLVL